MLSLTHPHFVNRHDTGMLQSGCGLSFRAESLHVFLTGQHAGQDHLHGNRAVERLLMSLVHNTHAASRDLTSQFVLAKVTDAL